MKWNYNEKFILIIKKDLDQTDPIKWCEEERLYCLQNRKDYSLTDLFPSSLSLSFIYIYWG